MNQSSEKNAIQYRMRKVALVIAFVFMIWMGLQWLGGQLGLPAKLSFALDFLALLAFMWALYELWKIWRDKSQN